jgi:hypothetical protein
LQNLQEWIEKQWPSKGKEAIESHGEVLFIQHGSELLYDNHKWTTEFGPAEDYFYLQLSIK